MEGDKGRDRWKGQVEGTGGMEEEMGRVDKIKMPAEISHLRLQ